MHAIPVELLHSLIIADLWQNVKRLHKQGFTLMVFLVILLLTNVKCQKVAQTKVFFNGFPCYTVSYYDFNSVWPCLVVIYIGMWW